MRLLTFALTLALLPGAGLLGQVFRVNYDLQSTDFPAIHTGPLDGFLSSGGNSYFLVQGFACDTGGFGVSLRIADERARKAHTAILKSVPEDRIRVALPVVVPGEPRVDHRKLLVTSFATKQEIEKALQVANELQAEMHQQYRPRLEGSIEPGQKDPPSRRWLLLFVLVAAVVAAWLAWRYFEQDRNRKRHQLSSREAEMVQAITGEAPIIPEKSRRSGRQSAIQPHDIVDFRSTIMAAKKKPSKGGITIRKALDKAFETKSLNEIAKSPIHALQGLTPRHSKMLEEAFGVRTVEDLAALRYFELARAITVLARYEE